jgi:lipopolysaccharide export system permease protein
MAAIVVEASQRGLGPDQILAAIPLIVPSMMPFIIPPTTLFASCVVYGRLSADNEITAIKAAGINIMHVIWPGVFLGAAMSVVTMGLYYHLIPDTHKILRTAVVSDVEDFLYSVLKRDREIKGRSGLQMSYEMFVEQVQGKQLKNAIFKKKDKSGHYEIIAKAREAELHVLAARGEIEVRMRNGKASEEGGKAHGSFDDKTFYVQLPAIDRGHKTGARDMTWEEVLENQEQAIKEEQEFAARIERANEHSSQPAEMEDFKNLNYIKAALREKHLRVLTLATELQMRPALSCGCLFFVLVGCPVGIWFSKSDYLSAFITCFLPIVFLYYPLQLCSTNLAKDGKVDPALALWSANAAMGLMALLLFRRLLKN